MIFEKAYAKINLALEVGKEVNGYHEVKNYMIPISLYDELFFQEGKINKIECEENIANNICLRAAELFQKHFNITKGVEITIKKNIPIMAGLAGGSTDAAATLRGLNKLYGVNASKEELYELACQLGSDVPFFLYNKGAMCTGRGEKIEVKDFDFKDVPLLIIKPHFGLSTKEIYMNYKYDGISKNALINKLYESLKNKDFAVLDQVIFNDLEKVALNLSPELKTIFSKIEGLSYTPHISGSGPSIFILNAKAKDLENIKAVIPNLDLFLCHTI